MLWPSPVTAIGHHLSPPTCSPVKVYAWATRKRWAIHFTGWKAARRKKAAVCWCVKNRASAVIYCPPPIAFAPAFRNTAARPTWPPPMWFFMCWIATNAFTPTIYTLKPAVHWPRKALIATPIFVLTQDATACWQYARIAAVRTSIR